MTEKTLWYAKELSDVFDRLDSKAVGLSSTEAAQRLSRYGPNALPSTPPPTVWQIFFRQFYSPLIYILIAAACVSLFLGDYKDAGFITFVLVVNALIGGYQEWKAEQSSQALKQLLQTQAAVVRDGVVRDVPAEEVVPGDVVLLESGNRVSADLRLLESRGLEVDESLLTGESLPVAKDADWTATDHPTLADRLNMVYAGSTVTRGRCHGIVVLTGAHTSVGELARDVSSTIGGKPPLLQRMEYFTNVISIGTMVIAIVIGVLGATLGRYSIAEMFLFVVALAVAAIPEGLPVAMTVALAIATTRMARRGVIVRRLTAVEGLGSCTMIATDKTGTLTVNALTVHEVWLPEGDTLSVSGEGFVPEGEVQPIPSIPDPPAHTSLMNLCRAGVLCNEATLSYHAEHARWHWHGDAVDIALLTLGVKVGMHREVTLEQFPLQADLPFESERQFAASFHRDHERRDRARVFVKGAPEKIMSMLAGGTDVERLEEVAIDMARRGFRVLGLAEADCDVDQTRDVTSCNLRDARFLGFVGMIDPLRSGAADAVKACHESGVRVAMVTGDHAVTALAIARQLNLAESENQVMTGEEIAAADEEQLALAVKNIRVFARVAPRQKLEIVQAAREAGHFVAVTGDGANDAPALQMANIGVSMGKSGTDVAREASELVLSDDDFSTIVAGIEEGRIAYDNIRKVIFLLISTGAGELVLMGLAVVAGLPLPLLPVQLLWLNLVTNGIQDIALAFEPGEGDVLKRKPRPANEPIFNRLMVERVFVSAMTMGSVAFGAFYWMLHNGWEESEARNALLLMMVLFENFHIGNSRSESSSAFAISPLKSPILLIGAVSALGLHVIAMYVPVMRDILDTSPIDWSTVLGVFFLAFLIVPAVELHKWLWSTRKR